MSRAASAEADAPSSLASGLEGLSLDQITPANVAVAVLSDPSTLVHEHSEAAAANDDSFEVVADDDESSEAVADDDENPEDDAGDLNDYFVKFDVETHPNENDTDRSSLRKEVGRTLNSFMVSRGYFDPLRLTNFFEDDVPTLTERLRNMRRSRDYYELWKVRGRDRVDEVYTALCDALTQIGRGGFTVSMVFMIGSDQDRRYFQP